MVNVICGPVGSGKTERIIKGANDALLSCDGNIVFLSDTSSYSRSIKPQIRFINVKEYMEYNEDGLFGFLSGILASNSDVKKIYIDGLARILRTDAANMQELFVKLELLSEKSGVDLTIAVTASKTPVFLKKYLI